MSRYLSVFQTEGAAVSRAWDGLDMLKEGMRRRVVGDEVHGVPGGPSGIGKPWEVVAQGHVLT